MSFGIVGKGTTAEGDLFAVMASFAATGEVNLGTGDRTTGFAVGIVTTGTLDDPGESDDAELTVGKVRYVLK